jgi:hypothetical protein
MSLLSKKKKKIITNMHHWLARNAALLGFTPGARLPLTRKN